MIKVHTVTGMIDSNTFVVESAKSVIIIDAGAPIEKIKEALDCCRPEAPGCCKPEAIFLTHEHYDHVYYLEDYEKEFGCPVHLPETEDEIVVGDLTVKPILAPGHSPKSVVYQIEDMIFTGDVLFSNSIGRTDFPESKPAAMQKTLKRLQGLDFRIAYHGHYESSSHDEQKENIKRFIK